MKNDIYVQTADVIAALDLNAINARIAELEADNAELEGAIAKGEAKVQQLAAEIRDAEVNGPSRSGAGDALLADVETIEGALKTVERLSDHKGAIHAGISELRRRQEANRQEIRTLQDDGATVLMEALKPLCDHFRGQAVTAAETLRQCYASLYCLSNLSRGGRVIDGAFAIGKAVRELQHFHMGIIPSANHIPVPVKTLEALSGVKGLGKAGAISLLETAPGPF